MTILYFVQLDKIVYPAGRRQGAGTIWGSLSTSINVKQLGISIEIKRI